MDIRVWVKSKVSSHRITFCPWTKEFGKQIVFQLWKKQPTKMSIHPLHISHDHSYWLGEKECKLILYLPFKSQTVHFCGRWDCLLLSAISEIRAVKKPQWTEAILNLNEARKKCFFGRLTLYRYTSWHFLENFVKKYHIVQLFERIRGVLWGSLGGESWVGVM